MNDTLPLSLELIELRLVCRELGTKLEAFRLFLGDELEKVRVPWKGDVRCERALF